MASIPPPGSIGITLSVAEQTTREARIVDTSKAIDSIAHGASKGRIERGVIADVIASASVLKPRSSYDRDMRTLRHNYLGDQEGNTRAALKARYPKTAHRIPTVTQNITAETAELDAQVYRPPALPERWRESDGLIVDDEALTKIIEEVTRSSLSEVEAVACIARLSFAYVERCEAFDGQTYLKVSCLWPHQVHALVDGAAPSDLWRAPIVIVALTGVGTDHPLLSPTYEIWMLVDGVRASVRIDDDGRVISPLEEYGSRVLPIVPCRTRQSTSIFPHPDRDLLLVQEQVNVTLCDHHYRFGLQAHQQIIGTGMNPQHGKELVMGPDTFLQIPESGASVTVVQPNDSLAAFDSVDRSLLLHARGRRQPVEAWHTKGGNPESGESRKIKNEYSDQKRAEHIELFRDFDRQLQRSIQDAAEFAGLVDAAEAGTEYYVRFSPAPVYENETAKTDRMLKRLSAGLISPAQAAVMDGIYQTIEEAVAAGLSTELQKKAPPPVFGAKQPENDEEEGEEETEKSPSVDTMGEDAIQRESR
jgi:hypothetical protein